MQNIVTCFKTNKQKQTETVKPTTYLYNSGNQEKKKAQNEQKEENNKRLEQK